MWTSLIPLPYRIGILISLFAASFATGWLKGVEHEQEKWQADIAARAVAESSAITVRVRANAAESIKQSEINATITGKTHEELAPVVQRIYVDRVRVGPSLCGGTTATAQAESTGSSNAADSTGRLVSAELEIRIRELEIRVEEALAAGRACQSFVKENGMSP